jgi:hypothetical protein
MSQDIKSLFDIMKCRLDEPSRSLYYYQELDQERVPLQNETASFAK